MTYVEFLCEECGAWSDNGQTIHRMDCAADNATEEVSGDAVPE